MSIEFKNLYVFIEDLKKIIDEEIKENNYIKLSDINNTIIDTIENKLIYYDYIRDVEIINYLETEVCISHLFKIEENEGIANFLNRMAKYILEEHFMDLYYKENFNKKKEVIK